MKKQNKKVAEEPAIPDTWNNPFVGLKIDLPEPPPPPPPPPPTNEEKQRAALNDEDKKLLAAFDNGVSVGTDAEVNAEHSDNAKLRVTFNIQRKGKGGKTVTNVFGLQKLDLTRQMELCNAVKNALGCGARFLEGVLEIQGDQRTRAIQWFSTHGFKCD